MSDDKPRKEAKLSLEQRIILQRRKLDRLREQDEIETPPLYETCKDAGDLLRGLRKHRAIADYPLLTRACKGDLYCATLLAQLLYWLDKRKGGPGYRCGVQIDGERYIVNTAGDWAYQLGLKERRVRRIIEKLRDDLGFIRTMVLRSKFHHGQPTLHLAVVYPVLSVGVEIGAIEDHRVKQLMEPDLGDYHSGAEED